MNISVGDLSIRAFRTPDLDALFSEANNPKVARWLSNSFPVPYLRESGEWWIEKCQNDEPTSSFAICRNDVVIGGIGVGIMSDIWSKCGELGYWLGEDHWGQGIVTLLLPQFVVSCFANYDLERIEAWVHEANGGSARVLLKSGFTLEGVMRSRVFKNGETADASLFSILKDEVPK